MAVSTAVKTAIDRSKVAGFDMNKAASTASKCATIDFYYARLQEAYEATANKYPMAAPHLEAPIACFDRALRNDIAPSDAFASAIACIKAITKIYNSAAESAHPVDMVAVAAEAAKAISDTNTAITAKAAQAANAIAAAKANAAAQTKTAETLKAIATEVKAEAKARAEAAAKDPSVDKAATEAQNYFKVFLAQRMKIIQTSIKSKTPEEKAEVERTQIPQIKGSLLEVIEHMIDNECDLNTLLFLDLPILHHAIIYNLDEAVQKLLVKGASPDAKNSHGQSAWDIARNGDHVDTLKILEEYRSILGATDHDTTPPDTTNLPMAPTPEDAAVKFAGADVFTAD